MSALTDKLRDSARRAFARPYGYVTSEWERLAPRQRRLLQLLLATIAVVVVVVGTTILFGSVSDLEEGNAEIREALAAIAKHRDAYMDAKARGAALDARIGHDPPQLTADLEAAAREQNIQIAESSERPTTPAGKRYLEHDVDLKLREVDLQTLANFLRRVEAGPRLVTFTRLSIKRRYSEGEKLDVEATATAFERVKEDKSKKKPPEGKKE
jgi:type II secretory pathway component PulM